MIYSFTHILTSASLTRFLRFSYPIAKAKTRRQIKSWMYDAIKFQINRNQLHINDLNVLKTFIHFWTAAGYSVIGLAG